MGINERVSIVFHNKYRIHLKGHNSKYDDNEAEIIMSQ